MLVRSSCLALAMLFSGPAFADENCTADMSVMMNMSPADFDQGEEGWRQIAGEDGCEAAAADLISTYLEVQADHRKSLLHHQAQLRAASGQTEEALSLLREVLALETSGSGIAYHKAEIAFLEQDHAALLAARDELAAVPKPEGFDEAEARLREAYPDYPPAVWPVNLDVVEGFIACFDKPYAEAYSAGCGPGTAE